MTQYNLRLDERTKQKASLLAKKKGISENTLYQLAIEEFLAKTEATDFYHKLMKRIAGLCGQEWTFAPPLVPQAAERGAPQPALRSETAEV